MATRLRKDQTERSRLAIKTTQIIHRLQKFVDGEVEMTSAQIRAAEILLKKTVPDLSSVEMVAEVTTKEAVEMTDAELAAIAAGSSKGAAKAKGGEGEPSSFH